MDMDGDSQVCRNCKKSVPSTHLVLHEAHCLRFLSLCPMCEEPVPATKMKEHCESQHLQVKCTMCQKSIQKSLLESHEAEECQERPIKCKFCELAVQLSKLETHQAQCGSQRERCPQCGQLILLWLLPQHKDLCQHKQAQPGKGLLGALTLVISMPELLHSPLVPVLAGFDIYSEHKEGCSVVSEPLKHLFKSSPSQAAGNQTPTVEKDVRPKTKKTSRFLLPSESSAKQASRSNDTPMDLPLKSELKPTPMTTSPTEDEAAYNTLRRCSQCGILLPLPTLSRHQVKCQRLASSNIKQVRKSS
ncbi:XIAP-associated factor 1 [Ctenodactylus gundi]